MGTPAPPFLNHRYTGVSPTPGERQQGGGGATQRNASRQPHKREAGCQGRHPARREHPSRTAPPRPAPVHTGPWRRCPNTSQPPIQSCGEGNGGGGAVRIQRPKRNTTDQRLLTRQTTHHATPHHTAPPCVTRTFVNVGPVSALSHYSVEVLGAQGGAEGHLQIRNGHLKQAGEVGW
jgi:hypothetical protein